MNDLRTQIPQRNRDLSKELFTENYCYKFVEEIETETCEMTRDTNRKKASMSFVSCSSSHPSCIVVES